MSEEKSKKLMVWSYNGTVEQTAKWFSDIGVEDSAFNYLLAVKDIQAYRNAAEHSTATLRQRNEAIVEFEATVKAKDRDIEKAGRGEKWLRIALKELGATESQIESLSKGGDDVKELWPEAKKPLKGGKRAMRV